MISQHSIKLSARKPRNPLVAHVVKRGGAGKHVNKKREAKNRGYE
jgi:hypothetical protein